MQSFPPTLPFPFSFPRPHSSSSAFSPHANPDEDWTKVSDLAERRRIQNRIAQRNYRKKLKHRLEDLEQKTAPEFESHHPHHKVEDHVVPPKKSSKTSASASASTTKASTAKASTVKRQHQHQHQHQPPAAMFSQQCTTRPPFASPPPVFAYPPPPPPPTTTTTRDASHYVLDNDFPFRPEYALDSSFPSGHSHSSDNTTMLPSKDNNNNNTGFFPNPNASFNPFGMSYVDMTGFDFYSTNHLSGTTATSTRSLSESDVPSLTLSPACPTTGDLEEEQQQELEFDLELGPNSPKGRGPSTSSPCSLPVAVSFPSPSLSSSPLPLSLSSRSSPCSEASSLTMFPPMPGTESISGFSALVD